MHEKKWQRCNQRIETNLRAVNPPREIIPRRERLNVLRLSRQGVTEIKYCAAPLTGTPAIDAFY